MAGTLQQRLNSLRSKTQLLTERYAKLADNLHNAEEQIAQLQATVRRQEKEINLKNQQIEHLQVVSVLSPSREDIDRSRNFLSELVRDIDKCINELSE